VSARIGAGKATVADGKLKLYFDTTIPNYLFVKESLDDTEAARLILERHGATCLLWERCAAEEYDVFVSDVFDRELRACPEPKLGRMREKMVSVKMGQLLESDEVLALAAEYARSGVLLPKDYNDCLHIAYAVVNGCDVILSWNFRHIVNDTTRGKVKVVNAVSRYNEILIVSPDDFLAGGY
jgi:predicted nucleic acid-binding protein